MPDLPAWLDVVLSILGVATLAGVVSAAWRASYSRTLINTQAKEIELLTSKVQRLEHEAELTAKDAQRREAVAAAQHQADNDRITSLGRDIDLLRDALSGRADLERLTAQLAQHDEDVRRDREAMRAEMRSAVDRIHRDLIAMSRGLKIGTDRDAT